MSLLSLVSLVAAFVSQVKGSCQTTEPWILDTFDQHVYGTVVFKNVLAGKRQSMSWSWATSEEESWQNKISQNDADGSLEGSLTYRRVKGGDKTNVHVGWKLAGGEFTSVTSNKKIYNASWDLTTWNGYNFVFRSNKLGSWEFTVLEDNKITNDQDFESSDMDPLPISRRKRSEEEPEIPGPEILQAGVMDCLFDFFFGDGDETAGRTEGVFTKMKNWFKGIACRFRGDCQGGTEQTVPDFPLIPSMLPITLPPFNPDSTSNTKTNDVETFDK